MPSQTTTIAQIPYNTHLSGPPNAPLTLLTHALMSNLHMWDSTVHALNSAGYQTLRFDHIGHNLTRAPEDPNASYSVEDITHHMHALLQSVTGQPDPKLKAIIGCSIGGVLALRYAMLYPDSVSVVISLCAPGIKSLEEAKPLWTSRIQQFESDLSATPRVYTLAHATVARWLPGPSPHDEAVRAEALEHVKTCSLEGYQILADAIRGYDYSGPDQLGTLADVERVAIVAGGRDGAVRHEVLRELAEEVRRVKGGEGVEFVLMGEAGHIPPMHCAEEFEGLVLRVLGGS